jgi:FMN phosphatase YigB (HAD superfamily)
MNVIAFDLDNTLINSSGGPIPEGVQRVNLLFEHPDNFIVIYTARSYAIFHQTRDLLLQLRIKHHALVCEKLRASLYIDDKAEKP